MSPFDKKLSINWARVEEDEPYEPYELHEPYKLHRPGIEPGPLAWKARILTTGPSVYK